MLWTALTYNPVRILGIVGMLGVAVALACALWLVGIRASGVTELSSWSAAVLFLAVCLVLSASACSLLVSHSIIWFPYSTKEPVRQGLFGKPLFNSHSNTILGGWG